MDPRPSSDESRIYPKTNDDYSYSVVPSAPEPPKKAKKKSSFWMSTACGLRLFALFRFTLVLLLLLTRSVSEKYFPIFLAFFVGEFLLVTGSLSQDIFSLTLTTILGAVIIVFSGTALIFCPVTLSVVFAGSQDDRLPIVYPNEFKLPGVTQFVRQFEKWAQNDRNKDQLVLGMEAGMNAQIFFLVVLLMTLKQVSLFCSVISKKVEKIAEKRQNAAASKKRDTMWQA